MIDRSKCKKMLVWDNEKDKRERIVIDILKDGRCIAVIDEYSEAFFNGHSYGTIEWNHCGPIHEKKFRLMTNAEMRGFIANTSGIVMRYKKWDLKDWRANCEAMYLNRPEDWQWRTISPTGELGEPQEFVVDVEE